MAPTESIDKMNSYVTNIVIGKLSFIPNLNDIYLVDKHFLLICEANLILIDSGFNSMHSMLIFSSDRISSSFNGKF